MSQAEVRPLQIPSRVVRMLFIALGLGVFDAVTSEFIKGYTGVILPYRDLIWFEGGVERLDSMVVLGYALTSFIGYSLWQFCIALVEDNLKKSITYPYTLRFLENRWNVRISQIYTDESTVYRFGQGKWVKLDGPAVVIPDGWTLSMFISRLNRQQLSMYHARFWFMLKWFAFIPGVNLPFVFAMIIMFFAGFILGPSKVKLA